MKYDASSFGNSLLMDFTYLGIMSSLEAKKIENTLKIDNISKIKHPTKSLINDLLCT